MDPVGRAGRRQPACLGGEGDLPPSLQVWGPRATSLLLLQALCKFKPTWSHIVNLSKKISAETDSYLKMFSSHLYLMC